MAGPSTTPTGWGYGDWGSTPWGRGEESTSSAGTNAPYIAYRSPGVNAQGVDVRTRIEVVFRDNDANLDTTTARLYVNNVLAVQGSTIQPGFAGTTQLIGNSYRISVFKLGGFAYESIVTLRARIEDATALVVDSTWAFNTQANPICYTGLTPLDIERAIALPMQVYLDLEPVRETLFSFALNTPLRSNNTNDIYKAARAIYQTAFSTELATLQNKFVPRNTAALQTVVCEKRNLLGVDKALELYKSNIDRAIAQLDALNVFPKEYIFSFYNYLDSTQFNYRVSLACNLVLVSRAIELRIS